MYDVLPLCLTLERNAAVFVVGICFLQHFVPFLFCLFTQVLLRLIHPMNGNSQEFVFSPHDSAADVAQHVFDNWPQGKLIFYRGNACFKNHNKTLNRRVGKIFFYDLQH